MFGSEDAVRDILEYVVYEKNIVNEYGAWRIHGKIVPKWSQQKTLYHGTVPIPDTAAGTQSESV